MDADNETVIKIWNQSVQSKLDNVMYWLYSLYQQCSEVYPFIHIVWFLRLWMCSMVLRFSQNVAQNVLKLCSLDRFSVYYIKRQRMLKMVCIYMQHKNIRQLQTYLSHFLCAFVKWVCMIYHCDEVYDHSPMISGMLIAKQNRLRTLSKKLMTL